MRASPRLGSNPSPLSQNTIDQPIQVGLIVLRRERDSNPRGAFTPGGFQDRCIQPLCHPSGFILLLERVVFCRHSAALPLKV